MNSSFRVLATKASSKMEAINVRANWLYLLHLPVKRYYTMNMRFTVLIVLSLSSLNSFWGRTGGSLTDTVLGSTFNPEANHKIGVTLFESIAILSVLNCRCDQTSTEKDITGS